MRHWPQQHRTLSVSAQSAQHSEQLIVNPTNLSDTYGSYGGEYQISTSWRVVGGVSEKKCGLRPGDAFSEGVEPVASLGLCWPQLGKYSFLSPSCLSEILYCQLQHCSHPYQYIVDMPRWQVNLHPDHHSPVVQKLEQQLCTPFGFTKDFTASSVELPRKRDMLENKLFEVATASKTQIFMTIFMFWMFGNNISIFVMFPIIQTLMSAVGGLLNLNKVFAPYEGMLPSLFKYKFMYLGINLILLACVIYKMSAMGLLPVLAADYVDLVPTFDTQRVMAQA